MAQHPGPYGYGQWPAQPPPQPGYGAPAYHGQYHDMQLLEGQYAQSQASFAYNASIPGLGNTPAASPPSAQYPNTSGGWGHAYSIADSASSSIRNNPQTQVASSYLGQQRGASPVSASGPTAGFTHSKLPEAGGEDAVEDGELSEGMFDDLYEPVGGSEVVPTIRSNREAQATHSPSSGDVSVEDAPETPFYEEDAGEAPPETNGGSPLYLTDEEDEEGEVPDQRLKPSANGRDRTGSYSPYLSPREIHHEDEVLEGVNKTTVVPGNRAEGTRAAPVNGGDAGRVSPSKTALLSQDPQARSPQAVLPSPPGRTMDEAKKEAQKSILGLVPYGVKYQTYLDEGFDENIIKSLFIELGLNPSSGPIEKIKPSTKITEEIGNSSAPSQPVPAATAAAKVITSTKDKAEERKDRIARLLAEKASKSAATAPAIPPSQPGPKSMPEKAKSEKELLLQKKMDALNQARQKRAEEAAARAASSSSEAVVSQTHHTTASTPDAQPVGNPPAQDKLATPSVTRAPSAEKAPSSLTELLRQPVSHSGIPGGSSRKRPVASDFVDYDDNVVPPKRRFGQPRQDSSLVINVSDDSDDDVDMEMDSPVEGPTSFPIRKGPVIRDFPPLSDVAQRNYASSASSVPTPPSGPRNGAKPKDTGYSKKLREIEDLRRKIADLESKQASKTPVRAQTPNRPDGAQKQDETLAAHTQQRLTSGDAEKDAEPSMQLLTEAVAAKLPKLSDLRNLSGESKQERRVRISSVHLPKLEVTLQEKIKLLRLWEDKVKQLQIEVDEVSAERGRLADEMAALADDSPASSPPAPPVAAPLAPSTSAPTGGESAVAPESQETEGRRPEDAVTTPQGAEDAPNEAMDIEPTKEGLGDDETNGTVPMAATPGSAEEHASASYEEPVDDKIERRGSGVPGGEAVDTAATNSRSSSEDQAPSPGTSAEAKGSPSFIPTPADGSDGGEITEGNAEAPNDAGEASALPTHISDVRIEDAEAEEPTVSIGQDGEVHVVFPRAPRPSG